MAVNNLIKVRRGTASDWSSDPVLAQGEPGFDTTNNILKIGDGTTAWSSLAAVNNTDHPTISAASSVDNSGNTFVQDITVDSNGHITAITSATASEGGSGGISNVVEDTTPQLGGNLDLNSKDIIGAGDINATGHMILLETMPDHCGIQIKSSGDANGELHVGSCSDAAGVANAMGIRHSTMTGANDYMICANTDGATFVSAKDTKTLTLTAGGNSSATKLELRDNSLGFRFNVNKSNVDLQYNGDNENNVFYIDASADSIGVGTSAPQTRLDVSGIITGSGFKTQNGTSSQFLKADGSVDTSTYLSNVVEDTTPQLGGNLDAQSNQITAASKIEITNTSTDDSLLITTTEDSSTAAPVLTFKRNSSSPADADYLGQLKFKGENDADQEVVYAKVTAKISDATDTTEDGLIEFALRKAGSNNIGMRLTSTELKMLNGTSLDMGSQPIENVTDPSSAQDAATKNYVDSNALMDSEVTNLAQVKAFDSSDYATAAQGTKADSAQQPPAEGAFVDGDKTKLDGIEASADVTDTANVTAAGALMDSELTDLAGVKGVTISTLQVKPSEGAFANGDKTKLDGIETGATADQTDEEIQDIVGAMLTGNTETGITVTYQDADGTIDFAVASQTDENFTTADHSKLDGIEANADVTDTTNVTAAGALMDSELTDLAGVKGVTISTLQPKPSEGAFANGDKTKLDGIEANATADQTDEEIQDIVGAMVSSNTETGITVTYQDADGTLDFVVDHDAASNFVANEHIDHTSVTLTAGDGLTGGGDISANRTFAVNVDDSTIEINSDALRIKDAAITSAKIGAGGFVFNEAGAAVDFRVEGDTNQNLLFVDGSADKVGIGTDSPAGILHVKGEYSDGGHITIEDTSSALKTRFYNGNTASVIAVDEGDAVGTSSLQISVDNATKATFGASATTFDQNVTINASTNQAVVGNSVTVFNEGGANIDFRVEGDTDANLLFADASTDRVGIGTNTPAYLFDVDGAIGADEITVGESNKYLTMRRVSGGTFGIARIHELLGSFELMIGANTAALEITNHSVGSPVVTFNPAGIDMDFIVEGDTDTDLLFCDAGNDIVQIGKLNINGAFTLPTSDGSANQVLKTNGAGTVSWADDSTGGGGGGGSMTTVKANGSQVGGADIVTLDFGTQFAVTESPDTEINITLADDLVTAGNSATIADGSSYELAISSSAATLGGNRLQLLSSETVVNNAGSNIDFRVEGDTDTHLVHADAGLDKVGIGLSVPTEKLDVDGNIKGGIVHATSGLNVGVSGLIHQSGTLVHSTHAAWGEFPGNAQNSINLLTGETTNATFTSLEMNNGMYSGVKLPSNKTFFADVNIVGRRTNASNSTSQHAAYQLKACINNDGFGRSIIGSVNKTVIAESNSAWDVQLAFAGAGSGQTDYLLVQCKGAASTNVHWVAKVDLLEVGGLNEASNYREANIYSNMTPELIP